MATKNLSDYDKSKVANAKGLRFGIVVSEWNTSITENLFKGAKSTLLENGVIENHITRLNVPGSFELVFGCKSLLKKGTFDVLIAIGAIIQGETKHFDFVSQAVSQGIKDLNVLFEIPTIFCVLTDNTIQQSKDRSGGKLGNKGVECAVSAIKMALLR
jgi:6,7-dimethyl-8-ribityllumazine synthase